MTDQELRFKIIEFLQENYNYDTVEDMIKDAAKIDRFMFPEHTASFATTVNPHGQDLRDL